MAQKKMSVQERARQTAARIQEEERKRTLRNRMIMGGIVTVVLVLVATAVWYIVGHGKNNNASSTLKNVRSDYGISIGANNKAGTENKGKPEVAIYYDYLCSWCNILEKENGHQLSEMARKGEITLIYHPVIIQSQYPFSPKMVSATYWVAENVPERALDFIDAAFDHTKALFDKEKATVPDDPEIQQIALNAGLTDAQVKDMMKAISEGRYTSELEKIMEKFQKDGLTGAPSVFVDGKKFGDWRGGKLLDALKKK